MKTAARGGRRLDCDRKATGRDTFTTLPAAAQVAIPDLPDLRDRLVGVRRRLVERLSEDWPDDRRFPDSAWCRMLSDVHDAIGAVDAVIAEGKP